MAEYDFPPTHQGYPGDPFQSYLQGLQEEGDYEHLMPTEALEVIPRREVQTVVPKETGYRVVELEPAELTVAQEVSEEVPDISPGVFLLRCAAGDVYLRPEQVSFEESFLVLFFPSRQDVHFTPRLGTCFAGHYVVEQSGVACHRYDMDLYYSGIMFTLPDQQKAAVIFHLRGPMSCIK